MSQDEEKLAVQGYEAVFEPELDRKYLCPVCLAAMRDAMQTSCGHRFCRSCVMNVVNGRPFAKCPVDNTWFRCEDELFADNAVRREILSLTVRCNNTETECDWQGELRDLDNHMGECEYEPLPCPNGCEEIVTRGHLANHVDICEYRLVQCQHCNIHVIFTDLMKHQVLICDQFPVRCTLCGQFNKREDIPKHIDKENGDCPHVLVKCDFHNYGCQYLDKRRLMSSHHKEEAHHHMTLVMKSVNIQQKQICGLTKRVTALCDSVAELQTVIDDKNSLIEMMTEKLADQEERIKNFTNTSHNGRIQWKIPVSGASGVQQFISQSFYTGCPGYKVCICMELEGHKEGGESYVSLFVILEKGEHDDSLRFPFNSTCHVVVHDQSESRNKQPHTTVINCTDVPRCLTTDLASNSRRGRLRFMKTEDIKKDQYTSDGFLYLDIAVCHAPFNRD